MKNLTIKEIKEKLQFIEDKKNPLLDRLQDDERKGVQKALKRWYKKRADIQKLKDRFVEMNTYEVQARKNGYQYIAGIDEVGRGPLAGPVVSVAVILDPQEAIIGLDDSKKVSLTKREKLFDEINEKAEAVGIGIITAEEIDRLNILKATKLAMKQAIHNLSLTPDFLLIDAEGLDNNIPQKSIVQGDSKSNSIAAASIIAKITRDRMMENYAEEFPAYDFASNVGYGTKSHIESLEKYGASPIHRKSFAPVKNNLK